MIPHRKGSILDMSRNTLRSFANIVFLFLAGTCHTVTPLNINTNDTRRASAAREVCTSRCSVQRFLLEREVGIATFLKKQTMYNSTSAGGEKDREGRHAFH